MSILIIDSDPGSEGRLKEIFASYGFERLDIVKSAEQAREFLKTKEDASGIDDVNLIIIDSELEDGDGFELCKQIRSSRLGEHAYIIILVSSEKNETAIKKVKSSGANDFAAKPYEKVEFIKHLMVFAHNKVVLLVEDDPVIRQLITSLMYKKHMEMITKTDGIEAYNLINSMAPPKLALMDIGLPGMSGIKLVAHMRKKQVWRRTPIVMLTGSTDANDIKASLASGANDYIAKPFQVNDFVDRTDKYFED